MDYPWDAPEDAIRFVREQYARFGVPVPSDRCLDKTIQYVLAYVAKTNYFPSSPDEAIRRFQGQPVLGLTEPEKRAIVPEIEIYLIRYLRERVTDVQLNLCLWAALLYAWAEEGARDVEWYKNNEIQPFDSVYPGWSAS